MGCNQSTPNVQNEKEAINKVASNEKNGNELKIVAIMKVKPEAVSEIKPVFEAIVKGSQSEEGCIFYNLHQDINDSTRFIMLEEWKSQDAINFHNETPHYKAFKESSKDMIESSDVSVMKLVY